ncbi:hypothetical protein PVIIG_01140 [Plasmodium vivax India VII]|uniref:Uncharacterized protein n=1 Tax=Plasmodium vivax India VII TaxID=1077284 RepID=A0A0J9S8S5_PLAVI|nr:hypothetical protein PVIIG_01140 [Plasmodium vivax India VII]
MKMTTLWNIAIFAALLSKVVHIFLVEFARTKERGKFSGSILWTFFKTREEVYKRKILTEREEDNNDEFLMQFITDNNVSFSDNFMSLIDTKMLEDIDVKEKEITESIPIKEDTEEEKKKKRRRWYRECCKNIGKQCNYHSRMSRNATTNEKTEATTVEEGGKKKEEVEETTKKKRKRRTQIITAPKYGKSKRKYRWKRPSDSEENNAIKEEPVLVPRVPNRKYGNIFITKFEKEMAKQKYSKLLEIYAYKNRTSNDSEIIKLEDPGVSSTTSDNEELGKNKPSIEPSVQCETNEFNCYDSDILIKVRSEGNIDDEDYQGNMDDEDYQGNNDEEDSQGNRDEEDSERNNDEEDSQGNNGEDDSQENTDEVDSDSLENSSDSSHDLWKESENEENTDSDTDSDTETSSETLEQEEADNLNFD